LIGTGNQVVGVDLINSPAHAAEMKEFIQSDLDDGFPAALSERLKPYRFDRIMLQDILEHVRNPKQIMRDCAALLADNGQVLISIPNVANVTIRAALLFGRFEYSERGILDKTHVRFFTRASARRFIVQCGYEIVEQRATVMPIELALGLQAANPMMRIANRMLAIATSIFPSLFGYQLLYVARPHPTSKAVANSA
jgi:2-polyprenyl-3-methyl-5-hydroxy-6-metoxy-1,4-benzoquinol methylase